MPINLIVNYRWLSRDRLQAKCFFTLFLLMISFTCSAIDAQQRQALLQLRQGATASPAKEFIDSALREVAGKIQTLMDQSSMDKSDSVRLKELTARLAFLSDLSAQMSCDGGCENAVVNDTLSIAVLGFGLLLMGLLFWFQYRQKQDIQVTFRLAGVIFIGTVSVFLIPAGFDNNQITPVVGLLGTLAGYLIGSSRPVPPPASPTPPLTSPAPPHNS